MPSPHCGHRHPEGESRSSHRTLDPKLRELGQTRAGWARGSQFVFSQHCKYIACLYEMHATICRALRLEYDDVDERVVEIAAPQGASSDVMSMVDAKPQRH